MKLSKFYQIISKISIYNGIAMFFNFVELLLILINLILAYTGSILLEYSPSQYAVMFQGNHIQYDFHSTQNVWTCTPPSIFTYNQTQEQYLNNSGYNMIISGFNQNLTIQITSKYKLLAPTINQTSCQASQNCTIQIYNNCPYVNYFYYFDIIQITIPQIPIMYNNPMSYNIICDNNKPRNSFTWGQIILIVVSTTVITITAIFSKAWSWKNAGLQLKLLSVILITIFLAIGFAFVLSGVDVLIDIIKYFIIFLSFTLGSFSVMFATTQLLFLLPCFGLHRGINFKLFVFRYMDMIGLAFGIGLTTAWWLTDKNFLISDIIDLCIIVTLIKLIKFTSLKIPVLLYICTSLLMIIFIVILQTLFSISYQQKIQQIFYSPFLFVLPTISPVPNIQCSALYMVSLVYPGIILSYISRFDHSRSTRVYTITFIISFISLSIIWAFVNVVSPFTIPFSLMTIPVGLVCIFLFSNRRNQLRILWQGKFQDEQYKDNKTHVAELMQVVKKQKTPSQLTFKKSLLKGLYFRESNSSRAFSSLTDNSNSNKNMIN